MGENFGDTFGENFETIDNEAEIYKKLQELEEKVILMTNGKINGKEVTYILNNIDAKVSVDIDLSYDKQNDKYYFVGNEKQILHIPLEKNKIKKLGDILIKLFNHDIQLFGDLYGRSIAEDTWAIDGFEEKFISDGDFTKNEIEEIFVFVMKTKGIPMEEWKLESTVCKGGINNACKEALGK